MAVDRESFANTVFLGAAVPVYGPVTPGNHLWFAKDLPQVPHDPERARALLAGLDLRDRNGDGTLDDARGSAVRFSLLTQKGNTSREKGAAVIQEDLRRLGIVVDVVTLDPGALGTNVQRSRDSARKVLRNRPVDMVQILNEIDGLDQEIAKLLSVINK